MNEPRSFTRPPMSLHSPSSERWTKMPTEKLQNALAAEIEDSGNSRIIKSILEARHAAQAVKVAAATAESNRVLTEQLQQISLRTEATSQRLGRITVLVSFLAAIAAASAVFALLRK